MFEMSSKSRQRICAAFAFELCSVQLCGCGVLDTRIYLLSCSFTGTFFLSF